MNHQPNLRRAAHLSAGLLCTIVASFFVGCESAPPPPRPTTTITAKVPAVTALPETKEAQEKGGLEIAVVPALYKTTKKEKYSVRPVDPNFGAMLGASIVTGGKSANLVYVEEAATPFLDVEPHRLQFTVRINNKLSRVFRGQGAVVQFNVGGKLIPFDKIDYKEFVNGIVPPRNESEFTIYGPSLDFLPEKGTVGIYFFDVVTATDVAGNVTERQNYEWYFDLRTKEVHEDAEARQARRYMEIPEYQRALLMQKKRSMDDPDGPTL
ncbi:MAG: hypothetical protein HZA93_18680 [Verrucomicrobia bacterium]|nr:hypothetical protein [Verrucomicrobiota bacterium]